MNTEICSPISKLDDVWDYCKNPPEWTKLIVELNNRSNSVIKNSQRYCHEDLDTFGPKQRFNRSFTPKTLVCHDMKGGYLEDKYTTPINKGNCYTFYRWAQIDLFVYFSHHLITIPPLCWINAAHSNGVSIMGTFITEWNEGERICEEIFANEETTNKFIDQLVEICIIFKLEGWLLNIENKLTDTEMLQTFVTRLTQKMHEKIPQSVVIWYDSVTIDGKLNWQNELNEENRVFFDACDGIFLNYTWKEQNLQNSLKAAKHRHLDVYVGLDVFGRNCYGGGGFGSYLAAQLIRQYNLSIAIFAQGWTYETLKIPPQETHLKRFLDRDNAFWRSIWNCLYTHPISKPFNTFFYLGVDKDWYDLHTQQVQLSRILHAREPLWEDTTVNPLKGLCNCLQLHIEDEHTHCYITRMNLRAQQTFVHHLFSCDIHLKGNVVIYTCVKNLNPPLRNDFLSLVLLVEHANGCLQKIMCYYEDKEDLRKDRSMMELNPSRNFDIINLIWYRQASISRDWILRCYEIVASDWKVLEIGAVVEREQNVCLCGVGIQEIE